MAVSKITEKQITDNGVVSAADVLTGSIPENKSVFDKLPRFIITVLNGLIDKFNDSESSKITDVRVNGVSKVTNNIANITVDSDVSDVSENPISNKAAKAYADNLKWSSSGIPVDNAFSATSENPVQNKVVTSKFTEVEQNISDIQSTNNTHKTDIDNLNTRVGEISSTSIDKVADGAVTITRTNGIVNISGNLTSGNGLAALNATVDIPVAYKPYNDYEYFPIVYKIPSGWAVGYGYVSKANSALSLVSLDDVHSVTRVIFSASYEGVGR